MDIKTPSKMKCVLLCAETDQCVTFSIDGQQKLCRLHKTGFYHQNDGIILYNWAYYSFGEDWCPVHQGFVHERKYNLCVHVSTEVVGNLDKAVAYCEQRNSKLISLSNGEKLANFTTVMNKQNLDNLVKTTSNNRFNAYMGLNKIDGAWIWNDGAVLGPDTSWGFSYPQTSSTSTCVLVSKDAGAWNWDWYNTGCGRNVAVICEVVRPLLTQD
ncbi:hypothetical protein ACF0H5_017128 [Mactra antiquata]